MMHTEKDNGSVADTIDNEMIQNLKDAGCNEDVINSFTDYWMARHHEKALKLLADHRAHLLQAIHEGQKKLDCLDYFLYRIRKKETSYNKKL